MRFLRQGKAPGKSFYAGPNYKISNSFFWGGGLFEEAAVLAFVGGFVAVGYGVDGADVVAAQAQGAGVAPVWPAISGDGDVSKRT